MTLEFKPSFLKEFKECEISYFIVCQEKFQDKNNFFFSFLIEIHRNSDICDYKNNKSSWTYSNQYFTVPCIKIFFKTFRADPDLFSHKTKSIMNEIIYGYFPSDSYKNSLELFLDWIKRFAPEFNFIFFIFEYFSV